MDKITQLLIKLKLFNPLFIDPMTVATAAKYAPDVIAGIGAIGQGIGKRRLARKQKKEAEAITTPRPKYEVKDERLENAAMYRNLIQGSDPLAKQAEANIEKQVANQASQASKYAKSGGDVLNMLGASQNMANTAYTDIMAQSEASRRSLMSGYSAANTAIADEKQKAWDYNKKQKYDEDMATKAALTESSIQNKAAGGKELAAGLSKGASIAGEILGGDMAAPGANPKGKKNAKSKTSVSKKGIQKEVGLKQAKGLDTPDFGGIMGMLG
jgi:hypothetical protein